MTRSAGSTTRHTGRIRCAIYTRKSSEEGLVQELNSLQAQREACEAFINSQRHEGWVCLARFMTTAGSPARRWIGRLCSGCFPRKASKAWMQLGATESALPLER